MTGVKEKEQPKINKDIFKQNESIINVETSSKEELIIKKESKKFGGIIFSACMVLLTFFTVVCLIDVFSFTKGFFQDPTVGNIVGGSVTGLVVLLIGIFCYFLHLFKITSSNFFIINCFNNI